MLKEFFQFELATQLRQPLLWVCALIFGALAFGASTTDAVQVGGAIGNINRNAPVVVAQMLGVFSLMSMFVVTIFIAGTVLRDSEVGISDMLFATPMKKRDYLVGRFAAGLLACLVIFAAVIAGILLALLMLHQPWWVGVIMGLTIVLTATVGDLTESLIKRDLGVKDISTWLPGHGGLLDRLDSALPSAAAAYALFIIFT